MIGSITPLGERDRRWDWIVRAALYAGAAVVGGATIGYISARLGGLLLSRISDAAIVVSLAVTAAAYAIHEFGLIRLPVPSGPWRVPVEWANWPHYVAPVMWGLVLGVGILTAVPFAGYFILLGWVAYIADPHYGLAVGALYGFARAVPLLVSGFIQLRRPNLSPDPIKLLRTRLLWQPLNGLALVAFAGLLLQALMTTAS